MTITGKKRKKAIAVFFLGLLAVQDFYPAAAYALTSGPSQPEMQKFSPAGAGDMVDLFSGDFKYDIPLMEVGGYPVNLAYHSGAGIEDEASWVGVGWSLNPGSVNRNLRGLPDDFTGDDATSDPQDAIRTIQHRKDFEKVGGNLVIKGAILGWTFGDPSLKVGVYKDNYYGIGADLGASLNFNLDQNACTTLTAGLQLTTDSKSGVTVDPSLSLSAVYDENKENNNTALTGSFTYNTRTGLESMNLGQTFNFQGSFYDDGPVPGDGPQMKFGTGSWDKYFTHTYVPTFGYNTQNSNTTFSFDFGPQAVALYAGLGGEGYIYKETNVEPHSTIPAYGYLHYASGSKNAAAMLDFNREKDGPFITNAPAIPMPVSTQDYFEATSQTGMDQFRPWYNGNYITYDRPFTKTTSTVTGGITIGAGNVIISGAQLSVTNGNGITHEWSNGSYIPAVATPATSDPGFENVFFKRVGEQTKLNTQYYNSLWANTTQKVKVNNSLGGPQTNNTFLSSTGAPFLITTGIYRPTRDIRATNFSYLTAVQASQYGLDKTINGASRVDPITTDRISTVHKPHHISEITITEKDGKRRVYGIPVYNSDREEVSMSVAGLTPGTTAFNQARQTGLIGYQVGTDNSENNTEGRENIYNRKIVPPYATSYLLTGLLSPDYVDLTGNGITDDDLGTAVKFQYKQTSSQYQWRAPYEANMANYAEGFLTDQTDDKGNYVFGTRQLWYLDTVRGKTEVAVFYTSPRQDGLGVLGENGGQNVNAVVQELDSIQLFSSADLAKNTTNAIPIKVVHFQYDYSLVPGVPNNANGQGKLTLRKLWFTFGNSTRGQTNPYLFSYDMRPISSIPGLPANPNAAEAADQYTQRQQDRWGTYRQSYFTTSAHVYNNSEYPYSIETSDQDPYDERLLADRFASKWQLNSITTPTGGVITVNYESDDYSYVQDQKAMIMCPLSGVGTSTGNTGLISTNLLYVTLPVAVQTSSDLINYYLRAANGVALDNVFYKITTDLNAQHHNEYVYGYAGIDYSDLSKFQQGANSAGVTDGHVWSIPVKLINGNNPVAVQAWQLVQTDLPQYAYANYDNSGVTGLLGNVTAAVESIVQAFINLRELFTSFNTIARNSNYANTVDLSHSMIRLNYPVGKPNGSPTAAHKTYGKLGGGSRVHSVELSDRWGTMAGGATKTISYGVQYDYTTTDDNGNIISSGVASYEPEVGNEENPFHQPIDYTEAVQWGQDRYHYMEKPFGESYFPAPAVGYSQVKATSYGVDYSNTQQSTPQMKTGYTLSQFYTARDFPTQVDYLPLEEDNTENDLTLLLFASRYTDRVTTSQGFKVTLNDMHGKEKSVSVYDNNGSLITSTQYFYSVNDPNAQEKTLNNTVPAMDVDGSIPGSGMLIGTDAELITDLRESKSTSAGQSIGIYAGGFVVVFPFPFAGFNYSASASLRTYNSVSAIKVIHQYGLLQTVRTTQNGSTLTADNLLWDGQTGEPLLTRNQNEFNDYTYALAYPAFHAYTGMSGAYYNMGLTFNGFSSDGSGIVTAGNTGTGQALGVYSQYLSPGDELVDIDPGTYKHGWLIQPGDGTMRFVDSTGNFITASGNFMVVRSGRRNVLDASAGSVVTMTNPMVVGGSGYILLANVDQQVLDAKAAVYKDEWGLPVPDYLSATNYGNQTAYPPTTGSVEAAAITSNVSSSGSGLMDYTVNSSGVAATCETSLFEATVAHGAFHVAVPTRSYMDFGYYPLVNLPTGAIVSQVTLALTAATDQTSSPTSGILNTALLSRVTQFISCNSGIVWTAQPSTTTTNQVTLAASTSTAENYTLDITNMYNDWINSQQTNSDFALMLEMANESSATDITMIFDGPSGASPPLLTVYYYIPGVCTNPVNAVFNPYYNGVKGNWRPYYNYAYQVNRVQTTPNSSQLGGTDIRHSGYYNTYTPFWMYNNALLVPIASVPGTPGAVSDPRWVWATQSIYYDQKGNEVENVDALNRYSSVLYGYQQSLATAVATNARHNEIAFDGFEDYYFSLPTSPGIPCPLGRQLDMGFVQSGGQYCSGGGCIVSGMSHTGNYSLQLSGTVSVSSAAGSATPPSQWVGYDAAGHSILLANEQAAGFSPVSGKNYLLSLWVNDNAPETNVINGLTVTINGLPQNVSNPAPVVEGWKQLNLVFQAAGTFSLQIGGGASIYVDDIRLQPFDAEMKTFVYDDQSLRLMGQLDENNFGILYEYDEEGTPIRTKKETERGVMTVKESRQSLIAH